MNVYSTSDQFQNQVKEILCFKDLEELEDVGMVANLLHNVYLSNKKLVLDEPGPDALDGHLLPCRFVHSLFHN